MTADPYPIPSRLNLGLALLVTFMLLALLTAAAHTTSWWQVAIIAVAFGITMNTGYALIHEAEHNLFHDVYWINEAAGVILALFFPAPFHLIRQGHIGHHMRNRSDDEAFDFYFEGESKLFKWLQFYGIITGLFWIVVALSIVLAAIRPSIMHPDTWRFNKANAEFLRTMNPAYHNIIQAESWLALAFHGAILYFTGTPILRYCAVYLGFGFLWSAMQYVHHYGTIRDVHKGARNLQTFRWLDIVWLNHNWHLNHHISPTVPWIYLPHMHDGADFARGGLIRAYLRMWKGPRQATESVKNRYAGRIIR